MNKIYRLKQLAKYGWLHAEQISQIYYSHQNRLSLFFDILLSYKKYGMWSNQYLKERFWELDKTSKDEIGRNYKEINKAKEKWVKDFYANRKFLSKWSKYEIETSGQKREERNKAYRKHYKMGKGCFVEYGVELSRQHHLQGTISIGNHVLFAKNVFIDYSGNIIIDDNVKFTAGVTIESHHRDLEAYKNGIDINIPTQLHVCEGAYIGTHAIILDSCNYIGKWARVGAGAVVTKDVPDYAVVVGVPAKVIKILPHDEL